MVHGGCLHQLGARGAKAGYHAPVPPRPAAIALLLLALAAPACSNVATGGERCKGGLVDDGIVCESGTECIVTDCSRGYGCVTYCARPCDLGCAKHCGCDPLDGGLQPLRPVCSKDGLLCF